MIEFLRFMVKDIKDEHFTKREIIVYGIVYPLGLIAACVLAEMVSNL